MCYRRSSSDATSLEERNKTLIRSFINEIFNEHYLSSNEKYFAKESVEVSLHKGNVSEGFIQFISEFFKAFPDWRETIEHIVAENNLAVVFLNGFGIHKGEFHGIPPTNKQVNMRAAELYTIENERITRHWYVSDQLNLLKQTGTLLSEPL
jgi:predicted ester cyclase